MTHSSSYNSNNIIKRKPDSPMPVGYWLLQKFQSWDWNQNLSVYENVFCEIKVLWKTSAFNERQILMKEEWCYWAGVEFVKRMNCKEIKDIDFEIIVYNLLNYISKI